MSEIPGNIPITDRVRAKYPKIAGTNIDLAAAAELDSRDDILGYMLERVSGKKGGERVDEEEKIGRVLARFEEAVEGRWFRALEGTIHHDGALRGFNDARIGISPKDIISKEDVIRMEKGMVR